MQEDLLVLSDEEGKTSDDEYLLDSNDESSVDNVEESEEDEDSGEDEDSEEDEESEEDQEKKGTLGMPDNPYTGSKEKATQELITSAGKNGIPKQHLGNGRRDKKVSWGNSTTWISSGQFEHPDSYHPPNPASVSNKRSLESLAARKEYDKPRRSCRRSIQTATPTLATELAQNKRSKKQPNGMPKSPSKLHFDGWMPHRYARISTIQGDNTLRPRAYLITRDKFSKIEKELTGDKGRKLTRRDGDCLRGIELRKFQVQNIAVGRDGSVSVLGRLSNEKETSIWTRTVLTEVWGRERADQFLSLYLIDAGSRGLPNNKQRKIQQAGNDSESNWDEQFKALVAEVNERKTINR